MALEANRGQAKPEILFLNRAVGPNVAITAQSILYSPSDVTLHFVGSNPTPQVRPSAPLPGVASVYAGSNSQNWVTEIPQYTQVELGEVYPAIDAQFVASESALLLRLVCRPGCDLKQAVFELSKVLSLTRNPDGALFVRLGTSRIDPYGLYAPPVAYQASPSGRSSTLVSYEVLGMDRFALQASGYDPSLPLHIEMNLGAFPGGGSSQTASARDQSGNT